MSIFKGFTFKLPTYGVITPQTGLSFEVKSMTVAEVNRLKTSLVTPNRAHSLINDIIWDCIESKPTFIKTKDDFKRRVTTLDREALLYGLYHSTFGDEREFSATCSKCEAEQLIKISISKAFGMTAYPFSDAVKKSYTATKASDPEVFDPEVEASIIKERAIRETAVTISSDIPDEILQQEEISARIDMDEEDDLDRALGEKPGSSKKPKKQEVQRKLIEDKKSEAQNDTPENILAKKVVIELPISKVMTVIRQPSIYDEEYVLKDLTFASKQAGDLVNETIIIERFEEWREGDKVPMNLIDGRDDILYAYQSLPPRDRAKIFEEYQENFGKYCIELKSGFECNNCGAANDLMINIAAQFFRSVALS